MYSPTGLRDFREARVQQKTPRQRVRDIFQLLSTILVIVLAGYLFSIGATAVAILMVLGLLWGIADHAYHRGAPNRPLGFDFSFAPDRIFLAALCCFAVFRFYGVEYSWIPILMLILWEIGRKFFVHKDSAD
jgi:hypothetical protein